MSGAGDVNGDGFDDLILSHPSTYRVDDIAIGAVGISTMTMLGINGKTDVIFGNIAPELSLNGATPVIYDGSPVTLFEPGQLSLTDANSTTFSSASIQFVDLPDTTNEQLSVDVSGTSLITT